VETLKELEDDVKFKEEENKQLCARITELEASSNVTMETFTTENNMLKVKLENLESEMKEKLDLIKTCESEIVSLKDKLSEADNSSKEREELDRVKAELDSKIKIAQEKVKVTEAERDEVMIRTETLKSEKEIIQKVNYY
jgi:chromosome segregation ATPase